MKNRVYVIILITFGFLSLVFYEIKPYFFEDSREEKTLYNVIDRTLIINSAYYKGNSRLSGGIDAYINEKNTILVFANGYTLRGDSLKFNNYGGRLDISYHNSKATLGMPKIITIPDKNLNILVPNVKYPANLTLSDLVAVNSFSISINIATGDSLLVSPRGDSGGMGQSSVSDFVIAPDILKVKIDSKSINWGRLFLYIVALSLVDLLIYYLLPKLGYESKADKNDIRAIEKAAEYFKYDLINGELKTRELYNRSTLMLVGGILVAIGGVLVFTFSLEDMPNFDKTINNTALNSYLETYLIRSLRPALMLVFIEFIAIYLLKQYRALIDDYKHFYSINLIRLDNAIIYQIIQDDKFDDASKKKMIDAFNSRADKLNLMSMNDKHSGGFGAKELKQNITNFHSLIKLIKG